MTKQKIAKLIQEQYKFLKEPFEYEVSAILQKISDSTTEIEFRQIVFDKVSDTTIYSFESIDMSASTSILKQIKDSLKK